MLPNSAMQIFCLLIISDCSTVNVLRREEGYTVKQSLENTFGVEGNTVTDGFQYSIVRLLRMIMQKVLNFTQL